jgi:hypothetical protein
MHAAIAGCVDALRRSCQEQPPLRFQPLWRARPDGSRKAGPLPCVAARGDHLPLPITAGLEVRGDLLRPLIVASGLVTGFGCRPHH